MSEAVAVVVGLATGRKASQLYPPTHPAFVEAIDSLVNAVGEATQAGPFTLNIHQGRLYHSSSVIAEDTPGVSAVEEAFEVRRIESLTVHPGFGRTDAVGLVEILGLKPSPTLDVEAELSKRGVAAVTVAFLADEDEEEREERDRIREQDRASYHRLLSAMRSVTAQVSQGSGPDLSNAGNMIGGIIGRMLEDQSSVLGLATMGGSSDEELYHSINVMIYALTLGAALGLPEQGLASLGISAMLHDIGKAAFELTDPTHIDAMHTMHPKVGADILAGLTVEDPSPMLVAYEHHMNVDGTGFPERPADYVGHPFSRMVAIANRYANLTAPAGGTEAVTPDRAVMRILEESGTVLDPLFTRLFAKAMGVFPIGSLVRLTDHSVGVVCRPGNDHFSPVVRISYDESGLQLEEPIEIDLESDERSIVEVVDPASLNVAVSEHL